ncbi:hypothetical protein [Sphingomonas sp. BK235]|uniref:hypothetical protein n=1 Tax=Sphingomonas sp. BK235 TaxID=2512131 RepID=UPI0010484DAC|nr:hypothetical protein [Sphingomonas sp. BK235]TCP36059.1 hypothetical protein EV292_102650 [Sphingomonas sp. BK235]
MTSDLQLDNDEWAQVARAFEEAGRDMRSRRIGPTGHGSLLGGIIRFLKGGSAEGEDVDARRSALGSFLDATRLRQRMPVELAAPLLSFGYSERQLEALAVLAAPSIARMGSRRH